MKLSVSLSNDDVKLLDDFAAQHSMPSRSAALQYAVRSLRLDALVDDYTAAFEEWQGSEEADLWNTVSADGLGDEKG